ncbi:MAG: hypothetical protein P4M11_07190 [Candidatus Pacebacteria bacterium]|nr:hypothetical protein [Candidatus Paceibacterota bacterium]
MNIILSWIKMCVSLFEKSKQCGLEMASYFVFSKGTAIVLSQVVQFVVPIANQKSDCMISSAGHREFDAKLNSMKKKALELINMIVGFTYTSPLATKMNTTPFFPLCATVGPQVLVSLLAVCVGRHDKLEEILTDGQTSDLMVQQLRLLVSMLDDNSFYPLFGESKHKLIVDVALVLLRTTSAEEETVKMDPQNFFTLALDTCDRQSSDVCKTEAAKLLEGLCDHIDGALTFTSSFCCEAMRYACKGCNAAELPDYQTLSTFGADSVFLHKSTPERIVETCIVAMTDISYLTPKRKDVL